MGDDDSVGLRAHDVTTGRLVTVVLDGELDVAAGELLRPHVQRVLDRHPETVVLDAGGLGFMDSSGLRVLLEVARSIRRAGVRLVTRAPGGSDVRALIDITGTQDLIRLEPL